jgi:hypothetical protein
MEIKNISLLRNEPEKAKNITKYQYARNLIVLVVIFVLGCLVAHTLDSNWVESNREVTQELINNSSETYEIQRKITQNYKDAFDKLYYCLLSPPELCEVEATVAGFKDIQIERDKLIIELDRLNKETETIMFVLTKEK